MSFGGTPLIVSGRTLRSLVSAVAMVAAMITPHASHLLMCIVDPTFVILRPRRAFLLADRIGEGRGGVKGREEVDLVDPVDLVNKKGGSSRVVVV